jgi:hypothetical protein
MKYNRDFAIKGALVVAILIVIGVSAHLYAKRKREHFDFDMNSLTGDSKGANGTDGDSAFNIAKSLTPTADWASNATGKEWITSLKGEPGSAGDSAFNIAVAEQRWTGAVENKAGWLNSLKGKDWNNASVWREQGVTAAAGETKVAGADIVSYIIEQATPPPAPPAPLGSIMAYHIGHNPALITMIDIKNHLKEYGCYICDGKVYTIDGTSMSTPDLRGRFLYQEKYIEGKSTAYPNNGMGLSVDASPNELDLISRQDPPEGKVLIKSTQIPSHTHVFPEARLSYYYPQSSSGPGPVSSAANWQTPKAAHRRNVSYVNLDRHQNINSGSAGGDNPIDIRPPYFSLIYIIKLE